MCSNSILAKRIEDDLSKLTLVKKSWLVVILGRCGSVKGLQISNDKLLNIHYWLWTNGINPNVNTGAWEWENNTDTNKKLTSKVIILSWKMGLKNWATISIVALILSSFHGYSLPVFKHLNYAAMKLYLHFSSKVLLAGISSECWVEEQKIDKFSWESAKRAFSSFIS